MAAVSALMPPVDTFSPWVVGIAAVAVVGFVTWISSAYIKSKDDLHEFKRYVQEHYVRRDEFSEFRKEFRSMRDLMLEIAGKIGIPARRE